MADEDVAYANAQAALQGRAAGTYDAVAYARQRMAARMSGNFAATLEARNVFDNLKEQFAKAGVDEATVRAARGQLNQQMFDAVKDKLHVKARSPGHRVTENIKALSPESMEKVKGDPNRPGRGGNLYGAYVPKDDTVYLYKGGANPATAAHELRHRAGIEDEYETRWDDLYNASNIDEWVEAAYFINDYRKAAGDPPLSEAELLDNLEVRTRLLYPSMAGTDQAPPWHSVPTQVTGRGKKKRAP